MNELGRGRLAIKYIIFELLPIFLIGLSVFLFILIMFQSVRLSEYIILHGAKVELVAQLMLYMLLGYLPMLFPMALLFAVLMVYSRLSGDSEIVAFKSLGLTPFHLAAPVLIVGIGVSLLSLQTSFRLAPWGQRQFDNLLNVLSQTRPGVTIREGVFSEGFFDLVVYAHKVNSSEGSLEKVFIYDESDASSPATIIAKTGQVVNSNSLTGKEAFLRLNNGNLHKSSKEFYTKIDFDTYDINLFDPHEIKERASSPDAMNLTELREAINSPEIVGKQKTKIMLEWNRRWALSATCLIFSIIGYGLGAVTNRRTAKSGAMVLCVATIIVYWTLFVTCETLARSGKIPFFLGAWLTNFLFLIFGVYQFRKTIYN